MKKFKEFDKSHKNVKKSLWNKKISCPSSESNPNAEVVSRAGDAGSIPS